MTSQLELNSRAALCRQLAEREPANRSLWLAEAQNWLRLSKDKIRLEAAAFRHSHCLKASGGGPERRRTSDHDSVTDLLDSSNVRGGLLAGR